MRGSAIIKGVLSLQLEFELKRIGMGIRMIIFLNIFVLYLKLKLESDLITREELG